MSRGIPPLNSDITIDTEDFKDGAQRILNLVRPQWKTDKTAVKIFTNGITNKMLGYVHDGNKSDMVLIRINGNKTEIFLDRSNEVECFKILHRFGCAPHLYCIFNNGLCYEYIPGETLTRKEVRDPAVFGLITKEMAKLHCIKPERNGGKEEVPVIFQLINKFLHLGFSSEAPPGRGFDEYTGPKEEELRKELALLQDHLPGLSSPLVWCHNDLLLNNVIYNKQKGTVHFIDYEYTGMNYQAFDIANHFCEFAGVDELDYSFYPDRNLQFAWLREYLKHWTGSEQVKNDDVEKLYVQVNKFALASHFMWGAWALVQAKYSAIDFDYIGYAQDRFGEYFKRKDEFLALKMAC